MQIGRLGQDGGQQGGVLGLDAVDIDLQGGGAGLGEQALELVGGLLDVGADDDGAGPAAAHVLAHGDRRHRLGRQLRQGGEQAGATTEEEALAGGDVGQDIGGEAVQVGLSLGVHHAAGIAGEGHEPLPDAGAHLSQQEPLDLPRRDASPGLFGDIIRQVAGGVAKYRIAGEFRLGGGHWLAVDQQVVDGVAGDAPALEEGRGKEVGIKGPQFLGHDIGLHRVVAAQGGVGAADEQGMDLPPLGRQFPRPVGQGQLEVVADLAGDLRRLVRAHATGVGEDEEQGRGIVQGLTQGGDIPAGQQQAAMDGL